MNTTLATLLTILLMTTAGQSPDEGAPSTADHLEATRQSEQQPDRESRRREWRERREQMRNATPEERVQMRLDRMVNMTARLYELDDSQTEQVRAEIVRMQAEREAAMGPDAAEYNRLRSEMAEYWARQDRTPAGAIDESGESRRERWRNLRDDPEFRRIRDGLRAIEEKYPFDFDTAARRVEALLPVEQAEKGRERREQQRNGWRVRRDDEAGRDGQRRRRFEERQQRRETRSQQTIDPRLRSDVPAAAVEQPALEQAAAAPQAVQPAPAPRALHPWEEYVRRFISQHELTAAQTTSAMAIFRDVRTRAAQIEAAQADHRTQAAQIPDVTARQNRLKELDAPIEQLFTELKQRLDGLLTAAQRQKAGI